MKTEAMEFNIIFYSQKLSFLSSNITISVYVFSIAKFIHANRAGFDFDFNLPPLQY